MNFLCLELMRTWLRSWRHCYSFVLTFYWKLFLFYFTFKTILPHSILTCIDCLVSYFFRNNIGLSEFENAVRSRKRTLKQHVSTILKCSFLFANWNMVDVLLLWDLKANINYRNWCSKFKCHMTSTCYKLLQKFEQRLLTK